MICIVGQAGTICSLQIRIIYQVNTNKHKRYIVKQADSTSACWRLVRIGSPIPASHYSNTFQFLPLSLMLQSSNITTTTDFFHSI